MAHGGTWGGGWDLAGLSQAQWGPRHRANAVAEWSSGQVFLPASPARAC